MLGADGPGGHLTAQNGSFVIDFASRSTGIAATNANVKLDWGSSLNVGAVDADYYLECFLPSDHRLLKYRIDE